MKVAYHTLGCKLNFAETSRIASDLEQIGFYTAEKGEDADLIVINTCAVTQAAERKDRATIKQLQSQNPNAFTVVIGCYTQIKPDEVVAIEGVDLVLGAEHKFDVADLLRKFNLKREGKARVFHTQRKDVEVFFPFCTSGDRTRYFLKVQDGCDYFCTYCTVPIARGKSRNATVEQTVKEAEKAAKEGAKEIVISGVNIGDFGKSTGETFLDLVRELDKVEGIERYRISSIEPNLLTDEIIDFVANSRAFMPHFHIPLQCGSDEILEKMHRRYKREVFAHKIELIKKSMPNAFIGVDVIVGFNGETEDHYNESKSFLDSLDVTRLHVFPYSPRPNTAALAIKPHVQSAEKKRRTEDLISLSDSKIRAFYEKNIGKQAKVLWEESSDNKKMYGFTDNYIRVVSEYDPYLINKIQEVTLGDFEGECLTIL
ncbi:MAG: tRNA (N(6)-L-threonylcarbamoyladenosine(37)-C(2))-methylthiotransferase MtaB [Paludibacteraceae bacterium]|nr:tRNA (N(6)-L-threonylcarbamoyladenosine(37)-C(2))-methylthiotransferase MtaB [Paludibacteraceae bacterium]